MKKGMMAILMLIVLGVSFLTAIPMNVSAGTTTRVTGTHYLSPTTMYTSDDAVASFGIQMNTQNKGESEDAGWYYEVTGQLYLWDKTKKFSTTTWGLNLYRETPRLAKTLWDTKDTTFEVKSTCQNLLTLHKQQDTGYLRSWVDITVPDATTVNFTWLKVTIKEQYPLATNIRTYGSYWFKLIINTSLTYTAIDVAASALEEEIDPDEVVWHQFTVTNSGVRPGVIGFTTETIFKDEDGDTLNKSLWQVTLWNSGKSAQMYYKALAASGTITAYLKIVAPDAADAPANAELTIKITAFTLNDTKYTDTLSLGGAKATTSDEFTGDSDTSWYGLLTSPVMLTLYVITVVLVVVVIIIKVMKTPGNRGRTKYRKK